jgi:hypothetical protein
MKDSQLDNFKIGPEPRADWEKSFKVMHDRGDDELLIQDVFEDEVFEIWTGSIWSNDSENH